MQSLLPALEEGSGHQGDSNLKKSGMIPGGFLRLYSWGYSLPAWHCLFLTALKESSGAQKFSIAWRVNTVDRFSSKRVALLLMRKIFFFAFFIVSFAITLMWRPITRELERNAFSVGGGGIFITVYNFPCTIISLSNSSHAMRRLISKLFPCFFWCAKKVFPPLTARTVNAKSRHIPSGSNYLL